MIHPSELRLNKYGKDIFAAGPFAHHAPSLTHARSRSHGHDIQDSGEESDEAYVHTAACPDVLIWQQVLATSDSPAGPNAQLNNAPHHEDNDDDDDDVRSFQAFNSSRQGDARDAPHREARTDMRFTDMLSMLAK